MSGTPGTDGTARHGLLLIDKPSGPTSHDIVALVRRSLDQRRVGHTGTLDPLASGLLPLVVGRATRLARFLPGSPKVYTGTIRLGLSTDTDDATGTVLARCDADGLDPAQVRARAAALVGRLAQVPPRISARKIAGERLYRRARQGRPVEAPAAAVEVFRFDLTAAERPGDWRFVASVSPGTYVRALARDLGLALGVGGVLCELRRTANGPLRVEDAISTDRLAAGGLSAPAWTPLDRLPLAPARLELSDPDDVLRFVAGAAPVVEAAGGADPRRSVFTPEGRLLGIGELAGNRLRPRVVVAGPGGGLPV